METRSPSVWSDFPEGYDWPWEEFVGGIPCRIIGDMYPVDIHPYTES